jgi:protoheme IX farnesyltransferase
MCYAPPAGPSRPRGTWLPSDPTPMKPATHLTADAALGMAPAVGRRSRDRTPTRANDFYELAKPRLNFLVLVTTTVGYYMAVRSPGDWGKLLPTLFGTALTAAGAAVLNQLVEREHDKLMPRTRNRPLPAGRVSPAEAAVYGLALGVAGIACLALAVNGLTAIVGAVTLVSYIAVYTPLKRVTTLNTVVGAVPGALPPVMGWTAVHNAISPQAAVLFCILFFWQMPHFLAIATMYRRDYAAGGFKMLPVVDESLTVTGRQIMAYGAALIPITLMPTLMAIVGLGMTGVAYFVAAFVLGLGYLTFGITAAATRERADARRLFFASIIYLPLLLGVMMADKL